MENLSHSRQPNILSKKSCNGSSNKPTYDDVFGGPTLSPRIEDYREIFGGFRSSRASSIPVLDVPLVDDEAAEVLFDVRSSGFDYSEVFSGLNGDDFAVSFEELVMMMEQSNGQTDSSDDEAWTPAEADNLSEESDRSIKDQCLSNGDSHESIDEGVEFKVSYNKASGRMDEDFSNAVMHIAQHHDVSGYTFAVDKTISFAEMEDECKLLEENDISYGGEMLRGKHLKKVKSHPANGDELLFGNDVRPHREFSRNNSLPSGMFVTISDVSLRTQPSDLPPPSRPPPALDSGKATSTCKTAASEENASGCSSPYFDVEVDANSSAAVSSAAMKEAMEKAQAQMKTAKESMLKRREGFQTRTVLKDERKDKEEKVSELLNGGGSRKDERGQISYQREENGMEFIVLEEKQTIRMTTQLISDTIEGKKHLNVVKASAEENYGRESSSSEGSDSVDEAGEWKEATQFFELVTNKSRKLFGHEDNESILVPDPNFHEHQKEKKETVEAMQQLNEYDKKVKAVRAYHQLKQSEKKSHVSKESFEQDKIIRISEKKNKQKLDKKLQVAQEASGQVGSEKKVETYQQPMETVRKPRIADVSMKHGNSLDVQKKESTAIGNSMKHKEKGGWSKEDGKEDGEKTLRKAFELKENEKKLPPSLEFAENERRLKKSPDQVEKEVIKAVRKQEEIEKLQRETYEREDKERRLKETLEKEEKDRKLKETLEEEDRQRRQREAIEREEKEKKAIEAREREKNERQREACGRDETEKKLKEALEKEETQRMLRETVEREETAKHQREENEMRLKEELKKEERQRKQIETAKLEENIKRERGENEKRLRETRKKEENERRLEVAAEQEDNEKGQRKLLEREEREKKQNDNYEKEESEMRCQASVEEEIEQRMKGVPENIVGERMEEVRKQQENCLASRAAQEMRGSETAPKKDDKPEEIREVWHSESKWEAARKLLVGTSENGKKMGLSSIGKDHSDLSKACKLDEDKNHQTANVHGKHERNSEKLEATEEMVCDEIHKKFNEQGNVDKGAASCIFQGNSEHERSSLPAVNFTCIEQKANEKTKSSFQEDLDIRIEERKFAYEKSEKGKDVEQMQVPLNHGNNKDNFMSPKAVREPADSGKKLGGQPVMLEVKGSSSRTAQQVNPSQITERKVKNSYETIWSEDKEAERLKREAEQEKERLRKIEEEREREREREKDRMAVDRSTIATRERVFAEARERAERVAVERATAEARQRALHEARERLEKACAEAREKTLPDKASAEARIRAERAAVERATAEARERAFEKALAERATSESRERIERSVSDKFSASSRNGGMKPSSSSSDLHELQSQVTGSFSGSRYQYSSLTSGAEGESPQRCKARLERHRRTAERAAKALAEKNMRDLLAQREQAERHRLAETLDADVKRWSSGKEGNLRALLSTLQYILGPDSGWQPIPLTEVITAAAVKKAYRKATLCVHPDKLQQRGASIQQKYICEKVFDLLKEAWNKFNSEER